MTRKPDILTLDPPAPHMPSACTTHGCGGPETPRPAPPAFGAVVVNGVEIAPDAIAREAQFHPAASPDAAWTAAARALATRELLLQEARRLKIPAEPETDEQGRAETLDDALVRALLDHVVEPARASDAECRRYYDGNKGRFRTPTLFEASHILIEPDGDNDAAWEAAHMQARDIADAVGDDAADFAAAAREFSTCPTGRQDGSLGQIRRGELADEVQRALEELSEGTAGRQPVRSRFGWHVLRLQRRIPGQLLPYAIVRDRIADMLEARAWTMAGGRYIAELAQAAELEGITIEAGAG